MSDLLATIVALAVGSGLVFAVMSRFSRDEAQWLGLSYLAHVLSAFVQVWMTSGYYEGGDMLKYQWYGGALAAAMRYDFAGQAPEVLWLFLQQPAELPLPVLGAGTSTGTMVAVAAGLMFLLGDSIYPVCLAIATCSFLGKVALYVAARASFAPSLRFQVAVACLLTPSVVFWSCGILKESVAIAGVGAAVFAWTRLPRPWAAVLLVLALQLVSLTKAYILFALMPAFAVWFYWSRALRDAEAVNIRPVTLAVAGAAAMVAIVLLGRVFPKYALENIADEATRYQTLGNRGGSAFSLGSGEARSLTGQLLFAPLALLTAWFRPFLFEIRNAPMAVAAVETTVLIGLSALAIYRRGAGRLWTALCRSPILAASIAFAVLFGVAVGLATANMGTLSRYRMPLLPFLTLFVLTSTAPLGDLRGAPFRRSPA